VRPQQTADAWWRGLTAGILRYADEVDKDIACFVEVRVVDAFGHSLVQLDRVLLARPAMAIHRIKQPIGSFLARVFDPSVQELVRDGQRRRINQVCCRSLIATATLWVHSPSYLEHHA
jgi:hypothetical protein